MAAKCYSLLFVFVRGFSFWSGIFADISFSLFFFSFFQRASNDRPF